MFHFLKLWILSFVWIYEETKSQNKRRSKTIFIVNSFFFNFIFIFKSKRRKVVWGGLNDHAYLTPLLSREPIPWVITPAARVAPAQRHHCVSVATLLRSAANQNLGSKRLPKRQHQFSCHALSHDRHRGFLKDMLNFTRYLGRLHETRLAASHKTYTRPGISLETDGINITKAPPNST